MQKSFLKTLILLICLISLASLIHAGDPADAPGTEDPAYFSRMPGFHIYRAETKEFDRYEFSTGSDSRQKIEGRLYQVIYYANEGITQPSGIQITRNYVNAAKNAGGEEVYAFEDGGTEYSIIKLEKESKEIWAEVSAASNGMYEICIVEKQLMKQEVTVNADALAGSIKDTGRVAVYGIYFDTNKSDLKPASDEALNEIVKMLKANESLKIFVVGHTDNTGQFNHNIKLSQERAAAVVKALVSRFGIAAARLTPFGAGPTSPVANNSSEEGRAKNRRVELVSQ